MVGIDNLKKVALLVIQFGQQIDKVAKDGFQIAELFAFLPELSAIPDIVKNKKVIIDEFKDLSSDELKELVTYVEDNLKLINQKTEVIIEAALSTAVSILELVEAVKGTTTPPAPPVTTVK